MGLKREYVPLKNVNNFPRNPYIHFPITALVLTLASLLPLFLLVRPPSVTPETGEFLKGDSRNLESYEKSWISSSKMW